MDRLHQHRFTLLLGLGMAVAGCASVPRSDMQTVDIEFVTPSGEAVGAARCALSNALGEWEVDAPGKVTLSTDASPLQLRCKAGAARGELSVDADVRGGRGRRALVGGGIGLAVGGLIGANEDRKSEPGWCCSNLGAPVGALLGTLIGSTLGATTADPRYAYPTKLRVVLQPVTPPR